MKYSDNFNISFSKLIKNEGGYVNDPADAGGETKYGISKRSYPNLDIKNLTLEQAKEIYFKDFWIKNKIEAFGNFYVSDKLFDMSVNMGSKTAITLLQRAIRSCLCVYIEEDGICGPKTLSFIETCPSDKLLVALRSESAGYYRLIAQANKSQNKFLNGWLKRAYS